MTDYDYEFFAYILIDEKLYYIQNISTFLMGFLAAVDFGDTFNIKGLGKLQVVNTYYNSDRVDDTIYTELSFVCNRI